MHQREYKHILTYTTKQNRYIINDEQRKDRYIQYNTIYRMVQQIRMLPSTSKAEYDNQHHLQNDRLLHTISQACSDTQHQQSTADQGNTNTSHQTSSLVFNDLTIQT